jgi:hypothetical protein
VLFVHQCGRALVFKPQTVLLNGRCRMHGGASPGAPRGEGNGMWRHGLRSVETLEQRRKMTSEMRRIRREMRELACP